MTKKERKNLGSMIMWYNVTVYLGTISFLGLYLEKSGFLIFGIFAIICAVIGDTYRSKFKNNR